METREVLEYRIWKLILNPMRGNTENSSIVAVTDFREKLIDWYEEQLAEEEYAEVGEPSFECHGDSHNWHKVFKKGSVLEWYNPISNFEKPNHYGHGISDEWINEETFNSLPLDPRYIR